MAYKSRFSKRLKRRALFAAPIVAIATGCSGGDKQETYPATQPQPTQQTAQQTQTLPMSNRPDQAVWREKDNTCWDNVIPSQQAFAPNPVQVQCLESIKPRKLVEDLPGACFLHLPAPPAPPGVFANPPPPQSVVCPPELAPEPKPEPEAAAPLPDNIQRRDDGTCWEVIDVKCPEPKKGAPIMTCNPPPPRQVTCPSHAST